MSLGEFKERTSIYLSLPIILRLPYMYYFLAVLKVCMSSLKNGARGQGGHAHRTEDIEDCALKSLSYLKRAQRYDSHYITSMQSP